MTRPKGFLQMFAIPPTGVGAGLHLDFHLDTHKLWEQTDLGGQEKAKEESKKHGHASYTDKVGRFEHSYDNGRETTISRSSFDSYPYDNGEQSGRARDTYDS